MTGLKRLERDLATHAAIKERFHLDPVGILRQYGVELSPQAAANLHRCMFELQAGTFRDRYGTGVQQAAGAGAQPGAASFATIIIRFTNLSAAAGAQPGARSCQITSYSLSGHTHGDAVPTESLSINYGESKHTYTQYDNVSAQQRHLMPSGEDRDEATGVNVRRDDGGQPGIAYDRLCH
ncbi:MAG: hypothetical protein ACLP9L_39230, partial [Thermoguttaceae bacterium]